MSITRLGGRTLRALFLGAALLWSLLPVYWMVATSFKTELAATSLHPDLWPRHPTLANYAELGGATLPFARFFLNSLLSCVITASLAVAIALPAAYALSRGQFRMRASLGYGVLVFRMLPLVVLLAPLYLLLMAAHLLDSMAGLIVGFTSFGVPFAVWMLKGFIDAVPTEVEEAARVDGYGRGAILMKIVTPLILPGLFTTGTFVFMDAWNNLIYPLSFITTMNRQTLPAALVLTFTGQFKTDWGGMMAASTLTTLPLMIAFFAVQRSMVRGLTAGAVAGA